MECPNAEPLFSSTASVCGEQKRATDDCTVNEAISLHATVAIEARQVSRMP